MLDIIRKCLRIRGTSRPARENVFGKLSDFVRDAIRDVRSRRDTRVGSQNDAVGGRNGHDGGSGGNFTGFQVVVQTFGFIGISCCTHHLSMILLLTNYKVG
jgi:hypothetical protein